MRINTNMAALNAWRALTVNNENMTKSLEKLSSGYRVNRAADDAAGLAVSEKMRAQIRGLNMAVRNAQDGISLIQTAEGGATQIQNMVQRMRELAVQAANGALQDPDRQQIGKEFNELKAEVTRTAQTTTFNRLGLLDGKVGGVLDTAELKDTGIEARITDSTAVADVKFTVEIEIETNDGNSNAVVIIKWPADTDNEETVDPDEAKLTAENPTTTTPFGVTFSAEELFAIASATGAQLTNKTIGTVTLKQSPQITLQIGVGDDSWDSLTVKLEALDAESLGIGDLSIDTAEGAKAALDALDSALEKISGARATLGSYQNRLENAIATLRIQSENLTAAESRIRDVDMAQEMANFTKYQILQQASTAMLAQANMSTQSILSLLR